MESNTDERSENTASKQPYETPEIQALGSVEEITLKDFGYSDAFLFRGNSPGGGGGGSSLSVS